MVMAHSLFRSTHYLPVRSHVFSPLYFLSPSHEISLTTTAIEPPNYQAPTPESRLNACHVCALVPRPQMDDNQHQFIPPSIDELSRACCIDHVECNCWIISRELGIVREEGADIRGWRGRFVHGGISG